jgi:multiple sugar transport system ATP-binding protein
MPAIRLEGLTKTYSKSGARAVDDVSLEIHDGEFMVLVGPSGCGKSTLMKMIAGIEDVSDGHIFIGDRDVTHLDPRKRDTAMVFQSYALYPHLTVRGNLGFGLKLRSVPKSQIAGRVQEVADILGLEELLDRKPGELSGGQRQRVAMGRAIAREPAAFLMDEPLSNLDAKLRVSMRAQLSRLHERLGVTTIYVTHDQVEAMTLGDRVAVLRGGILQQCDTPEELFRKPVNLFVAAFIGSPAMNLVDATVEDGAVRFADWRLPLPAGSPLRAAGGKRIVLGLRPHDLELATSASDSSLPRVKVRVDVVERLGTETHLVFAVDAPRVSADELRDAVDADAGDDVLLADDDRATFTAVVDAHHPVREGETVELVADPSRLYGFDPQTGRALGREPASVTLDAWEGSPRSESAAYTSATGQ